MSSSKAEYLKRYLTGGGDDNDAQPRKEKKKKRKRKEKGVKQSGFKIIDEDVSLDQLQSKEDSSVDDYKMDILDMTKAQPKTAYVPIVDTARNDGSGWVTTFDPKDGNNKDQGTKEEARQKEESVNRMQVEEERRTAGSDSDSDASVPRRGRRPRVDPGSSEGSDDSDASPPRRARRARVGDASPGAGSDSDVSVERPRRRSRLNASSSDSEDASPPRRRRSTSPESTERKGGKRVSPSGPGSDSDSDVSVDRRSSRKRVKVESSSDEEETRRERRRKRSEDKDDGASSPIPAPKKGLQTGAEFSAIARAKKREEEEKLKRMLEMEAPMETVIRDKLGRKMSAAKRKEAEEEAQRERDEQTNLEWGGGLVQQKEKKAAKKAAKKAKKEGFSRGREDDELNAHLKSQEHWGDPMLLLMRQRRAKREKKRRAMLEREARNGKKSSRRRQKIPRPVFEGDRFPNRYNIHPGYRWDGRDRSNGWERKRFAFLNSKKANDQARYKWSASDM